MRYNTGGVDAEQRSEICGNLARGTSAPNTYDS